MPTLTAAASASIRLNGVTSLLLLDLATLSPSYDAGLVDRYKERLAEVTPQTPQLSDEVPTYRVEPVQPKWLENTQRAIRESRAPSDGEATGDGRWLSSAVANTAHAFFANTADLLPSEPYIYSSRQGDLVAELEGAHGKLTAIIASTFVLLYADVDGELVKRRITDPQNLRDDIRQVTDALRLGQNGTLEANQ